MHNCICTCIKIYSLSKHLFSVSFSLTLFLFDSPCYFFLFFPGVVQRKTRKRLVETETKVDFNTAVLAHYNGIGWLKKKKIWFSLFAFSYYFKKLLIAYNTYWFYHAFYSYSLQNTDFRKNNFVSSNSFNVIVIEKYAN